jgi:hypothetical protein
MRALSYCLHCYFSKLVSLEYLLLFIISVKGVLLQGGITTSRFVVDTGLVETGLFPRR